MPCARLHAEHLAWEWGLTGITETIELLVSELTTNSVQAMAGHDGQPAVRLRLFSDNARVRIEVWDADPRPPAPKDPAGDGMPDLEAEGGRGLFLVAALSTRWGWCPPRSLRARSSGVSWTLPAGIPSEIVDPPRSHPCRGGCPAQCGSGRLRS